MSRYTTYVDLNDIEKIEIYVDKCYHTAKTLRTRLGCDYIINGGLYTFSSRKPNCQLKVDGTVLANDGYNYWAFCFNDDPKTARMAVIPRDTAAWKNAIACATFKYNGIFDEWSLNNAMKNSSIAYSTNRTAIGFKDGKLALYIGTDDMTPKTLYNYLNGLGWSDIMMLDGGGSTQGYLGSGKQITSSRCVHNYICVYLKKKNTSTDDSESNTGSSSNSGNTGSSSGSSNSGSSSSDQIEQGKNPYPVPTRAIQYYTTGNDVKWVQYQLNVHGYKVDVDGSYGPASLSAIKQFQKDHGLEVDGSCGPATQAELKKAPGETSEVTDDDDLEMEEKYTIDNTPYAYPSGAIQYGMTGDRVRWMQWMLNAHNYPVDIDGSFGPDCLSKVKEYQADHNLDVDGSCGPATKASLSIEE